MGSAFRAVLCSCMVAGSLIVAPLACAQEPVATIEKPQRPQPQIDRVLVVSIDGLRADCLYRADAPALQALVEQSSFTFWARTTVQSITLPSHVSMMTGVTVEAHGITWNGSMPFDRPVWPSRPTLFELAKKVGYTTAVVSGKEKFDIFLKPGVVDYSWITTDSVCRDEQVADNAVRIISEHKPEVMLLHFPGADSAGHSKGWGGPDQLAAIASIDRQLARVIDAAKAAGTWDRTLMIISADHGGSGRSHGPEDVRSRTIPWIAVGPGVRKAYDLTLLGKNVDVQTFDTFATACYVMGVPLPGNIDGKPIVQIFEKIDLLQPGPATKPTAAVAN